MLSAIKQSGALASTSLGFGAARCFTASAVQLKKRDPTLPTPPRGPSSAYSLFVKDWFPANKASSVDSATGKIDLSSIASKMGAAWTALTEGEKALYTDRAKDAKRAYDKAYREWYTALDPSVIKAIQKDSGKKLAVPGGKAGKKLEERNRPGNPGRPLTAFFEFMNEFRAREGEGLSVVEVGKQAGEKWRNMSDAEKQRYKDVAAQKKEKYVEWQKTL